jgi:hypothetical protein
MDARCSLYRHLFFIGETKKNPLEIGDTNWALWSRTPPKIISRQKMELDRYETKS